MLIRWTSIEDSILAMEWHEGASISRISALIPGRSRNAVVGRAHRMKLPGRESPIKPPRSPVEARTDGCAWLEGDKPYTPCSATREPGKPYCTAHTAKAYEKPKPRKKKGPLVTKADRLFGMVF